MGHNVEFVDYTIMPPVSSINERKVNFFTKIFRYLNFNKLLYRKEEIKSNASFKEYYEIFSNEWIRILELSDKKNIRPKLDCLIIGSDEVFNCTQTESNVGYSLELFGKENNSKYLFSYAASFGSTDLSDIYKFGINKDITNCLNAFNSISVRDNNSFNIVNELCEITPQKHIDPVFLYDFISESNFNISLKDYIVLYAYCGRISAKEMKIIRSFAKKSKKKVISLGFYQPGCDDYIVCSPFEVLAYFKNADYIITDTFHGCVMSIKYNKQFVVFVRESNKNKVVDLLDKFGLASQIIKKLSQIDDLLTKNIDYSSINSLLSLEKRKANEYIISNLDF